MNHRCRPALCCRLNKEGVGAVVHWLRKDDAAFEFGSSLLRVANMSGEELLRARFDPGQSFGSFVETVAPVLPTPPDAAAIFLNGLVHVCYGEDMAGQGVMQQQQAAA